MLKYCSKNFNIELPNIVVHANCDTPFAINLLKFDLDAKDELVFTIKNYDYAGSPHIFIFKTSLGAADDNGEVFFKISSDCAKNIKPGAFYTFSVLTDTTDKEDAYYNKITGNGKVIIDYSAPAVSAAINADNAHSYEQA